MRRAMDVRILVCIEVRETIDHRLRLVRRRRVVEPDERLAVHPLGEYREIAANRGDVERRMRAGARRMRIRGLRVVDEIARRTMPIGGRPSDRQQIAPRVFVGQAERARRRDAVARHVDRRARGVAPPIIRGGLDKVIRPRRRRRRRGRIARATDGIGFRHGRHAERDAARARLERRRDRNRAVRPSVLRGRVPNERGRAIAERQHMCRRGYEVRAGHLARRRPDARHARAGAAGPGKRRARRRGIRNRRKHRRGGRQRRRHTADGAAARAGIRRGGLPGQRGEKLRRKARKRRRIGQPGGRRRVRQRDGCGAHGGINGRCRDSHGTCRSPRHRGQPAHPASGRQASNTAKSDTTRSPGC